MNDIRLQNVTVRYPDGGPAHRLHGVDHVFVHGRTTLIAGQSGAGKSTLLDVVCGMIKPDEGDVYYGDRPLWTGAASARVQLLRDTGMVCQFPEQHLFARTVLGEFAYSLRPLRLRRQQVITRARAALEDTGLPDGLLPVSPLLLSGGQQRRLGLATELAAQPKWLLLDEPTAGLDPAGVRQLVALLSQWKQAAVGIVIATHDIDALLSIADDVLILRAGGVHAKGAAQALCEQPDAWVAAGLEPPAAARVVRAFALSGIQIPAWPPDPVAVADRLAAALAARASGAAPDGRPQPAGHTGTVDGTQGGALNPAAVAGQGGPPEPPAAATQSSLPEPPVPAASGHLAVQAAAPARPGPAAAAPTSVRPADWVRRLDPRAKWLVYILLSTAIFAQQRWSGVVMSGAVAAAAVLAARAPWQTIWRLTKPLWVLLFLSAAFAGLRFPHATGIAFSLPQALDTGKQVCKLVWMMVLGTLLPLTTTQVELQRSVEQGLAFLQRLRLPVAALSLGTALLFRFIPVLGRELDRFLRIAQLRGKRRLRRRAIPLRDAPAVVIPLVVSLLRTGEELADALEARGVRDVRQRRTPAQRLRFTRCDAVAVLTGALASLALLLLGR